MGDVAKSRRQQIAFYAAAAATLLMMRRAAAQQSTDFPVLFINYRGFSPDISAIANVPNRLAILASLQHQIDIALDCGARPDILAFFRTQPIRLKLGAKDGGGSFNKNSGGVSIDAKLEAPSKPVLLHELMHAYHFFVLPEGFNNPDVLRFHRIAMNRHSYKPGSYITSNVKEFFAVSASLYLWGQIDRPPYTRENLRMRQPNYYEWLGETLGVSK